MSSAQIQDTIRSIPSHVITVPLYAYERWEQVTGPMACYGVATGVLCQLGQYFLGALGAPLAVAGIVFAFATDEQASLQKRIETAALGAILYAGLLAINPYAWVYGSTLLTTMLATAVVTYPTYSKQLPPISSANPQSPSSSASSSSSSSSSVTAPLEFRLHPPLNPNIYTDFAKLKAGTVAGIHNKISQQVTGVVQGVLKAPDYVAEQAHALYAAAWSQFPTSLSDRAHRATTVVKQYLNPYITAVQTRLTYLRNLISG